MSDNLSPGCRDVDEEETIRHLGGRGLSGALTYTGTSRVEHSSTELRLYVNGRPGWRYVISITVSALDLYDVTLWGLRDSITRVLGARDGLYFDELQYAVEQLYDDVMDEANGGWIPA